ncbi:MAG: peptide chain release factor 1 [Streptosporangiaceae bacterium]|jgi:ribosome-associated protein|nr:peptide chain release factor 1 [Streptosporangiaceae bacterium]
MSSPVHVRGSITIPVTELQWRFTRASGPGGQNVNKVSTAVELSFDLAASTAIPEPLKLRALERLSSRLIDGVVTIRAEEHRSQWRNRQAALARLADLMRAATGPLPKSRRPTKPSRGMNERRLDSKRRRSTTKQMRSRPDV